MENIPFSRSCAQGSSYPTNSVDVHLPQLLLSHAFRSQAREAVPTLHANTVPGPTA